MSTPVEQIKSRLSIVDVVGSYIKLEKAGGSYKALCPFHHEKSPSFNVSPSRDAYYCFGCNRGGDIFTFVQEIEGVEFVDALRSLAARAGVELKHEDGESKSEREKMFAIMEAATEFYEKQLAANTEALAYLKERGLTDETIHSFRIGYAPLEWRALHTYLLNKKFIDKEIEQVGLTKPVEGKGYYDRFRGRVMFPIFDTAGRVVAFSGRVFGHQDDDVAKYINSPETPLYDKSSILFGYDRAKQMMRQQNFTILVEGQMDLIMAHQAGALNTVAVSGTALTEKHLALLKRLSENLVFAFDADDAGLAATARAFGIALGMGMNVRVAQIPEGKDPADYILKNPSGWAEVIANSKHIINFYLGVLRAKESNNGIFRKEVENKIFPLLSSIPSNVERNSFISEVSRYLADGPDSIAAVRDEVVRRVALDKAIISTIKPVYEPREAFHDQPIKSRRQVAEEEIIGILLWQEGHNEPAFDTTDVRQGYHALLTVHGLNPHAPSKDEERNLVLKAEHAYEHGPKLRDSVDEILDTLEMEVLKEKQGTLWRKLSEAEMRGAKDEARTYLTEYQEITPRLIGLEDRKRKRGIL